MAPVAELAVPHSSPLLPLPLFLSFETEPYPWMPSRIAGDWSLPEQIEDRHHHSLVVLCILVQGIELGVCESS